MQTNNKHDSNKNKKKKNINFYNHFQTTDKKNEKREKGTHKGERLHGETHYKPRPTPIILIAPKTRYALYI